MPITYKNVIYLTTRAQNRWGEIKLCWSKEMVPNGYSNPQEQMKEQMKTTRNGKWEGKYNEL